MNQVTPKTALVAGGSRGLGLLIAEELLRRGYTVSISGRDADTLGRARASLETFGRIDVEVCDIRDREAITAWVTRAEEELGPVEVTIAVAGIIQVGPLIAATPEMFDEAIDVMVRGPINLALAALPAMRARGRGRIGTVTSFGGMVAPPHLLPYVTAKFGAVGFSDGLVAELAGTGVTATTIVPGLMRTGSPERASFFGDHAAEYAWFSALASLPLVSIDAERAARRMVAGVLAGTPMVMLTPLAHVGARLRGLLPGTTARLMGVVNRLLPDADPGDSEIVEGRVAEEKLGPRASRVLGALTVLGRRAADRTNQRP